MYKLVVFLFVFTCSLNQLYGQVFPKEGSKLYYRIIGFSFPAQTWAVKYGIEIANGNFDTESLFEKSISISVSDKSNKIIAEVPYFGCSYTWRIFFVAKDGAKTKSILYHFSTRISADVDTATTRLRIIKSAEKYKDAYVFLDGTRVLYDMKGKPVWFLPGSDMENKEAYPRDLKMTSHHTITFIAGNQPYEITYSGRLLWHYTGNKLNQPIDSFHHEFTHLNNDHYMGMIYDYEYNILTKYKDSVAKNSIDSARFYERVQYSVIKEFDSNNNVIWSWSMKDYSSNSDLRLRQPNDDPSWDHDLHENSFFFDEKNKAVYISCRNISRIIKIKYPEGNVLNTYGTLYKPGITNWGNVLFCNQHSCKVSRKGYLYLFNNNTCHATHIPSVVMMKEPPNVSNKYEAGKNKLEKIWEYRCTIEDSVDVNSEHFHSGGNVAELPDESMFVSMGRPYCKVFIVGLNKDVLWSAIPERYDDIQKKWSQPHELYRASIITSRKDLEKMIWNSER